MTRKLLHVIVLAISFSLTATMPTATINGQSCQCPKSAAMKTNGNLQSLRAKDSTTPPQKACAHFCESTEPAQGCLTCQSDCQVCPSQCSECRAQAETWQAVRQTVIDIPFRFGSAVLTGTLSPVVFHEAPSCEMRSGSDKHSTAVQRARLAQKLTEYLMENDHDPEHVQQVLKLALDAMANAEPCGPTCCDKSVTKPAPPTTERGTHPGVAGPPNSGFQPRSTTARPLPASSPPHPVLDPQERMALQISRLKQQQTSTANMISLIQQDLQRIAEDLSQLETAADVYSNRPLPAARSRVGERFHDSGGPHRNDPRHAAASSDSNDTRFYYQEPRYSSSQTANPPAHRTSRDVHWPSQTESGSVEQLKARIHELETQLHQLRRASTSGRNGGIRPVGFDRDNYDSNGALVPRRSRAEPLTPQVPSLVTVKYYVGDLMEPPFHSATLQLMHFLKSNVDPESWTNSAMMQITEPSISLLITQTQENHAEITDLLQKIRTGYVSYANGSPNQNAGPPVPIRVTSPMRSR